MSDFGDYLKNLREKRGLGVNQLGNKSGVSGSLISKIENGHRGRPKPETIQKLSTALKVPYEEMMKLAGSLPEEDSADIKETELLVEEAEDDKVNSYILELFGKITDPSDKHAAEEFLKHLAERNSKYPNR